MVSDQHKSAAAGPEERGSGLGDRFLACSFLAEHVGMEGKDALDGNVAGRTACREVRQQRADDLEVSIEIDPVDGKDKFFAIVIDPGRGEARISDERLE
jgi:hypothetical protein